MREALKYDDSVVLHLVSGEERFGAFPLSGAPATL
jgi:hypothetical protein